MNGEPRWPYSVTPPDGKHKMFYDAAIRAVASTFVVRLTVGFVPEPPAEAKKTIMVGGKP